MDQQKFESEVMQDLADEAPPSSADDSLDEASNIEGYEEDAMEDAASQTPRNTAARGCRRGDGHV